MIDYAIVLNAGSSSLKFSVYRHADAAGWSMDARGQIDGIGSTPRFSTRDGAGASLADENLARAVDGRGAFDALAAWLQSRYGGGGACRKDCGKRAKGAQRARDACDETRGPSPVAARRWRSLRPT